jgi:hypothetical protein
MPSSSSGESRGFLNTINLAVTILVACFGAYLSWAQFQISSKQADIQEKQDTITTLLQTEEQELNQRRTITQQSSELLSNTKTYLESFDLDNSKKERILLSLLKIEKDLRVNPTGELTGDSVNSLPYNLALLVGDSEALAHIGGQQEDLNLWLPIAITSSDFEVRRTAIDTLKNVALLTQEPETLKLCVRKIVELARRWNVTDVKQQARAAMEVIAASHRLEEWPKESGVTEAIEEALRELEGLAAATAVGVGTNAPEMPESYVASAEAKAQLSEVAALRDLRQSYDPAPAVDRSESSLEELTDQLRSGDTKTRRIARSRIADYGDQALPDLFNALNQNINDYSTQIGVVASLSLMDPGTSIASFDLRPLVDLLGHHDKTLRTNTAVFLGQLADPASLEAVRQKLEDLSADRAELANQNLIYNSVIVLGDWLNYNRHVTADLRERIKGSLRVIDRRLEDDRSQQWTTTRSKIQSYLST